MKKFKIPLIKSTFYKEEETKKRLIEFIKSAPKLSMGKYVFKFEKEFAKWQGRKYGVMVNSGSSANLVLLQALKNLGFIKEGDFIAFSAVTWSTNVFPIIQLKFKPIPIDPEINTLNISSQQLEKTYKKTKFKVLFLTNLLGFCDDIISIKEFTEKHKIIFIEDNCESLGSEYNEIKLGNFGLASTFSFYVGHHLSTIEGGMILTDNFDLYEMLKIVRNHGWARDLSKITKYRLRKKFKIDKFYELYTFYDLGYNLRPTEIQGFLGLSQLKFLPEIIQKRERNFLKMAVLYENKNFIPLSLNGLTRISNFGFPFIVKDQKIYRNLINFLLKKGIETRPLVGGNMTFQPFWKKYIKKQHQLPNAKFLHYRCFYIGNNPEMTEEDIKYVIKTVDSFFKK